LAKTKIIDELEVSVCNRLHWLHPCHGPLPDMLLTVECDGVQVVAAVWDTNPTWITCCCDLQEDASYTCTPHTGLLFSRRWFFWRGCAVSDGIRVVLPTDARVCLQRIGVAAAELYVTRPRAESW